MFQPPAKTVSGYWTSAAIALRSLLAHARCTFARNASRRGSGGAGAASTDVSASTAIGIAFLFTSQTSRPRNEVHVHRHADFNGHAVQQGRAEPPLTDGIDRGGVEVGVLRGCHDTDLPG